MEGVHLAPWNLLWVSEHAANIVKCFFGVFFLLLLFKFIQFNKYVLIGDTKNLVDIHILDLAILFLEMYPKELIRDVCKDICAMMLLNYSL